jgi:hypothetical protein
MNTQAKDWMTHHTEMPTMTEIEDMGAHEGYDDFDCLVVEFPDGSMITRTANGDLAI